MSLKFEQVNPLNALGARRLKYAPKHFSCMVISHPDIRTKSIDHTKVNKIDAWIYQNLNGRYAIVSGLRLDAENKLISVQELWVEDAAELSILSLTCPYMGGNK